MSWLRLDDGFASHPKLAGLTDHQHRVWIRLLCYCARYEDPTVDATTCSEVSGLGKGNILVYLRVGLLDVSGDSFEVHDWAKYQPKDKTGAERQDLWRARRRAERNGESVTPVTETLVRVRANPSPTTPNPVVGSSRRSQKRERAARAKLNAMREREIEAELDRWDVPEWR